MQKNKQYLITACRILVGIVFIYSGFVKAVDPLGTTYKIADYFTAFGTQWATNLSFSLSVIQSIAEFVIGISLLFNFKLRLGALGALIFMLIFTPLTLYSAIANPVHDCGCFGDALILTNWQTFNKNVVILALTIFIFLNQKKQESILNSTEQWVGATIFSITIIMVVWYSYYHLPIIDFRPYKIGSSIPEGMKIPEGAPADVYESKFIYSKDGVNKEFDVSNLPDSTWKFVNSEHKLVEKGYTPPIHDFTIISLDGNDITDIVLANNNYTFLFIAYDIKKANTKKSNEFNQLANTCINKGYSFIGLTASGDEDLNKFISETNATFEFYNTDEITLKTIVRSNPGLVLLKNGIVINKWHYNDIPKISELEKDFTSQTILKGESIANSYLIFFFIAISALIACLYLIIRKRII